MFNITPIFTFFLANLETIVELKNILNQIVPPSTSTATTFPKDDRESLVERQRINSTSEEVWTDQTFFFLIDVFKYHTLTD